VRHSRKQLKDVQQAQKFERNTPANTEKAKAEKQADAEYQDAQ
jgi:hypothetical protein